MSLEGRVALLVVTGLTLCFPSSEGGGRQGRGGSHCQPLSPTTTVYTSRSTAGQAWKLIQFPRFPPHSAVWHCNWKHLNLCHQNCQLAKSHWTMWATFCAFATQCLALNSLVSGKAPLQLLAFFLEDFETSKLIDLVLQQHSLHYWSRYKKITCFLLVEDVLTVAMYQVWQ